MTAIGSGRVPPVLEGPYGAINGGAAISDSPSELGK